MKPQIGSEDFQRFLLDHPSGKDLWAREKAFFDDKAERHCFGQCALQIGMGRLDCIGKAKTARKLVLGDGPSELGHCDALGAFDALPFARSSLDAIFMPHTLEFAANPRRALREAHSALRDNGVIAITGFNVLSLWRANLFAGAALPRAHSTVSLGRLKDWLEVLGFRAGEGRFMVYTPLARSAWWLKRCQFLNAAGDRWWPTGAAVYGLTARKTTYPVDLLPEKEEALEVEAWLKPAAKTAAESVRGQAR